ncbi:17.1 kDa class II heat shock protein-like [Tasmannia lanceolata]|uniref:17.1 kDa class II heat shock protein-like n=1 Tax=Tasmannia lanceolata TaxID=3420 RepID=UPI0040637380
MDMDIVLYEEEELESWIREVERVLDFPDEMENMLQPRARNYVKRAKSYFQTPADIYEHPDCYTFVVDMPGVDLENIRVKIDNRVLFIAGKKKKSEQGEKKEVKPIRVERRRVRYWRKFTLPKDANPDDVKAIYKDGVLTVTVGKKKPQQDSSKPKTIEVAIS